MVKTVKAIACLLCASLIFVSGCKENSAIEEAPENSPSSTLPAVVQTTPIKLALITTDDELELNFDYANIWDGIITFSETNMLNYSYYKPAEMSTETITKQFEFAIEDGATVIVCMGDVFAPIVSTLQDKHPDTKFIIINTPDESVGTLNNNTHIVAFRQEQGGYLAGYGAVKDGFKKIGYMGDHPSGDYIAYLNGFIQGANDAAKALNTPVEITAGYTTDFENKEAALNSIDAWYKDGVELITVSSDDGFVEACAKKAVDNLCYLIGTNNDQSYLGANLDYNPFMTSTIKGLREALDTTLEMLLAGEWDAQLGGKTAYFGLQNGNYIYMPEYEATWLFKDFTLDEYHLLKTKISNGEIVIDGSTLPTVDETLVTLKITKE